MIGARNAGPDISSRAALSFLRNALPDLGILDAQPAAIDAPGAMDPPRLSPAQSIEGPALAAVIVAQPPAALRSSEFRGFLDGTQKARVIAYPGGVPIVLGTVSAAIRFREARRLSTWKGRAPAVERRLYVPFRRLGAEPTRSGGGFEVVDLSEPDESGAGPDAHPLSLINRAFQLVQGHREALESRFAETWCERESSPLFIDGGISGNQRTATSPLAIGVVKSHLTLYSAGEGLRVILGLRKGERSTVFRVSPRSRQAVASWYLRLRTVEAQDPFWGLVRVEVADDSNAVKRADEVSRWILAESSPLSLPDGRWDKMAYGIRDTEEFLRAIS